jgi:hypothetical protein
VGRSTRGWRGESGERGILASLLSGALLVPCGALGAQQAQPDVAGSRLSAGAAGLLVLSSSRRIALYDVNGDEPRKLLAFVPPGFGPPPGGSCSGATLSWDGELLVTNTAAGRVDVLGLTSLREGRFPHLLRAIGPPKPEHGRDPSLLWPAGVSPHRDLQDRVYVSDTANHRVVVLERTGRRLPDIGGPGSADGKLDRPMGLGFDPSGNILYVAEAGNRRVSAFSARSGRFLVKFGALESPGSLAVGPDGVVHVADAGLRAVARFQPEFDAKGALVGAKPLPAWGKSDANTLQPPWALALDRQGRAYLAGSEDSRCLIFGAGGELLQAFAEDADALTPLSPPSGLTPVLPERLCSNDGLYGVALQGSPPKVQTGQPVSLRLTLLEGCGAGARPAPDVRLEAEARMPETGRVAPPARVEARGGGRFEVTGLRFDAAGYWELLLDLAKDGVRVRAQADLLLE